MLLVDKSYITAGTICLALVTLLGCDGNSVSQSDLDVELLNMLISASADSSGPDFFKLPESEDLETIPQDANNPLTLEKVRLGQQLYHETALGVSPKDPRATGQYSCASCHHSKAGFQAGIPQGLGEGGSGFGSAGERRVVQTGLAPVMIDAQPLRSPSTLNVAFQEVMLWNGQFGSSGPNMGTEDWWTPSTPKETNFMGFSGVETQAIAGLKVHGLDLDVLGQLSGSLVDYAELFEAAFPEVGETMSLRVKAGLAIAAYERTLLSNESPFQLWLKGDSRALSDLSKQGAILFFGKANCVACHTGPALNSMSFHSLGMRDLDQTEHPMVGQVSTADRQGRGGFTGQATDYFRFKTPQLYNLKDVRFLGHGASFDSVEAIVKYKNLAVAENPLVPTEKLDPLFKPLALNETELESLISFVLQGLYDPNLKRYVPKRVLSKKCFPVSDPKAVVDLGCGGK